MNYQDIIFEISGPIATLTLNRPDIRNAITGSQIIDEIEDVCRRVNADMTVKVLIITAKDPAFSAGGNVKDMADKKGMFAGTPAQVMENYRKNIQRIPLAVHEIEVPTIAAVNGPAIGAGCDLALMCDMRIASEKAQFGETFLAVGLIPGDGGAYFLPRAVGMARACELTFTAEVIDAKTALAIGLVNDIAPHDGLMKHTQALAEKIAAPPYDVLSSEEARELARDNPYSFLHVGKPEIDLPAGTDLYADEVYAKGKENFSRFIREGALLRDTMKCFYIYKQIWGEHVQVGLVAGASCQDYQDDVIKKHELTREDKERDRQRHIETLNAQTGPVFLTYRQNDAIDRLVGQGMAKGPESDFTTYDGVRHIFFVVEDEKLVAAMQKEFRRLGVLYVADGHHRSAAATKIKMAR